VGAVHGLMVSGNVYELLGQAVEVARTPITIEGLIGPEIVFEDINVISRG
jgi:predicted Zn-dependent protease